MTNHQESLESLAVTKPWSEQDEGERKITVISNCIIAAFFILLLLWSVTRYLSIAFWALYVFVMTANWLGEQWDQHKQAKANYKLQQIKAEAPGKAFGRTMARAKAEYDRLEKELSMLMRNAPDHFQVTQNPESLNTYKRDILILETQYAEAQDRIACIDDWQDLQARLLEEMKQARKVYGVLLDARMAKLECADIVMKLRQMTRAIGRDMSEIKQLEQVLSIEDVSLLGEYETEVDEMRDYLAGVFQ